MTNMSDAEIENMVNTMKANPEMVRAQYKATQGIDLSDDQLNMIMATMNVDTVKMQTKMAKENP
jgi:hypothetical protein